MKELPSLEAVYIYLDNFVRREKAKLPRGDAWLFSYKIMKAENMRLELLSVLLDEANKQKDVKEFHRQIRHFGELYFWNKRKKKN